MKIKAVQIANALGLSKATVSLALNNKPGVSEQTRQAILNYKIQMENAQIERPDSSPPNLPIQESQEDLYVSGNSVSRGTILVVVGIKGLRIIHDAELDLWSDTLAVLEREVRKNGYMTSVLYVDLRLEPLQAVVKKYNEPNIKGIILYGTELETKDLEVLEETDLPLVIYDNESFSGKHHSVVIDNAKSVENAVEYLLNKGYRDILYLASDKDIYNFQERRNGFCNCLLRHNFDPYREERIVRIGSTINDIYIKANAYLDKHKLPQVFIMESFQISISMTRALIERKISIPEQIALIGIDYLPRYMTGNLKLTTLEIPHEERAVLAVSLLQHEINEKSALKSRIMTSCKWIKGESA